MEMWCTRPGLAWPKLGLGEGEAGISRAGQRLRVRVCSTVTGLRGEREERGHQAFTDDNAVIEPGLRGLEVEKEEGYAGSDGQGQRHEPEGALDSQPLHPGQHPARDVRKQAHEKDDLQHAALL